MLDKSLNKRKKIEEMIKITNISEEEFEKLDFKGKQKYFKAKNKLCKISFVSKDKNGRGITYVKPKEKQNERKN